MKIGVQAEGITKILLDVGLTLSKSIGDTMTFDVRGFLKNVPIDGGPIEFIGALEIDPATGNRVFSTTAIRFYGNRLAEDIETKDVAEAYYLASLGNQEASNAIESLRERNTDSFWRAMKRAKGYNDGGDDNRTRYMYLD